jgi:hypothetical protein
VMGGLITLAYVVIVLHRAVADDDDENQKA